MNYVLQSPNIAWVLITVDAISRNTCNYMTGRFSGCTTGLDFANGQLQQIAQHRWINLYETQTLVLHSIAMPEANENVHVAAEHIGIEKSKEFWSRLDAVVR